MKAQIFKRFIFDDFSFDDEGTISVSSFEAYFFQKDH